MTCDLNRRGLLSGAAGLATLAVLPAAIACEFDADTLTVTHPWTRATPAGATTARVCMMLGRVQVADRLIGVVTPVAEGAELGSPEGPAPLPLELRQGEDLHLTEDGVHLRLTGLRQPLELGRSYPMKLVFLRGGVVNAQLSVDFPATV